MQYIAKLLISFPHSLQYIKHTYYLIDRFRFKKSILFTYILLNSHTIVKLYSVIYGLALSEIILNLGGG